MSRLDNSMQPKISYETVKKVGELAQMPISRGFEKALLIILTDYESLKRKSRRGRKKL